MCLFQDKSQLQGRSPTWKICVIARKAQGELEFNSKWSQKGDILDHSCASGGYLSAEGLQIQIYTNEFVFNCRQHLQLQFRIKCTPGLLESPGFVRLGVEGGHRFSNTD